MSEKFFPEIITKGDQKTIRLLNVCFIFLFMCVSLTSCAGGKPDLAIIKNKLEKDMPKGSLKFGNCNEVRIRVYNKSKLNNGTHETNTELVIRKRNKSGTIVYTGKAKTEAIPPKEYKIAIFKNVNIPKSEITLYYIKATANIDGNEDEYKICSHVIVHLMLDIKSSICINGSHAY